MIAINKLMPKQSLRKASNIILNDSFDKHLKDASVQSQSISPILSLNKNKYQYPGLKQIDSYFNKGNFPLIQNGSISVDKKQKLAHFNILFQQNNNKCKYKRILPLFHLNPEDSCIYNKKSCSFKPNHYSKNYHKELLIDTQEKVGFKLRSFRIKNIKTSFLSSMSTDKFASSEQFWITKGGINNNNKNINVDSTKHSLISPSKPSFIRKSIYYRKAACNLSNSCLTYVKKTMYNNHNHFFKRNISDKGFQGLDSFITIALK